MLLRRASAGASGRGVPAVFLTDLGSGDYHRPTDDADRIDYEKLATTGRTALEFARTIANLDQPPCG